MITSHSISTTSTALAPRLAAVCIGSLTPAGLVRRLVAGGRACADHVADRGEAAAEAVRADELLAESRCRADAHSPDLVVVRVRWPRPARCVRSVRHEPPIRICDPCVTASCDPVARSPRRDRPFLIFLTPGDCRSATRWPPPVYPPRRPVGSGRYAPAPPPAATRQGGTGWRKPALRGSRCKRGTRQAVTAGDRLVWVPDEQAALARIEGLPEGDLPAVLIN